MTRSTRHSCRLQCRHGLKFPGRKDVRSREIRRVLHAATSSGASTDPDLQTRAQKVPTPGESRVERRPDFRRDEAPTPPSQALQRSRKMWQEIQERVEADEPRRCDSVAENTADGKCL